MKSYTDLEQSERLAKILSLETADMSYTLEFDSGKYYISTTSYKSWVVPKYAESYKGFSQVLPCWSLAALLDVLKDDIKIEKTLFDQSDMFTYSILGDAYEYRTYEHENLIDACVEMIIKLKELNLI